MSPSFSFPNCQTHFVRQLFFILHFFHFFITDFAIRWLRAIDILERIRAERLPAARVDTSHKRLVRRRPKPKLDRKQEAFIHLFGLIAAPNGSFRDDGVVIVLPLRLQVTRRVKVIAACCSYAWVMCKSWPSARVHVEASAPRLQSGQSGRGRGLFWGGRGLLCRKYFLRSVRLLHPQEIHRWRKAILGWRIYLSWFVDFLFGLFDFWWFITKCILFLDIRQTDRRRN